MKKSLVKKLVRMAKDGDPEAIEALAEMLEMGEASTTAGGFETPGKRASVLVFSEERAAAPERNFEKIILKL